MPFTAYETPLFQPAVRVIESITNANPAVVTTTYNNSYFSTDVIKIRIPQGFGMWQMNNLSSRITVLSPTSFAMDEIDSTNFDVFVDPGNGQFAQTIPVSEATRTVRGATTNVAPSFIRT